MTCCCFSDASYRETMKIWNAKRHEQDYATRCIKTSMHQIFEPLRFANTSDINGKNFLVACLNLAKLMCAKEYEYWQTEDFISTTAQNETQAEPFINCVADIMYYDVPKPKQENLKNYIEKYQCELRSLRTTANGQRAPKKINIDEIEGNWERKVGDITQDTFFTEDEWSRGIDIIADRLDKMPYNKQMTPDVFLTLRYEHSNLGLVDLPVITCEVKKGVARPDEVRQLLHCASQALAYMPETFAVMVEEKHMTFYKLNLQVGDKLYESNEIEVRKEVLDFSLNNSAQGVTDFKVLLHQGLLIFRKFVEDCIKLRPVILASIEELTKYDQWKQSPTLLTKPKEIMLANTESDAFGKNVYRREECRGKEPKEKVAPEDYPISLLKFFDLEEGTLTDTQPDLDDFSDPSDPSDDNDIDIDMSEVTEGGDADSYMPMLPH